MALVLVVSACGGGSDSAELEALREEVASLKVTTTTTTTAAPATTASTTTTQAPTTTTAAPASTAAPTTTAAPATGSGLVAFTRFDPMFSSAEIFVMNGDGTGLRQLTDIHDTVIAEFFHPECLFSDQKCPFHGIFKANTLPVWSPDGDQIAFVQWVSSSTGYDGEVLSVMNADGSDYRPLWGGRLDNVYPSWSSDSRQIAIRK